MAKYNTRLMMQRGDETTNELLAQKRKQYTSQEAAAKLQADIAKQNTILYNRDVNNAADESLPLSERQEALARVQAAEQNPADLEQPGISSEGITAAGKAAQTGLAAAPAQTGTAGTAQAGLTGAVSGGLAGASLAGGGAAAGATAGATTGGITGPQGALIGAGIGAAVGVTGSLLSQRAKRKSDAAQRQVDYQNKLGSIEAEKEQKRQNAFQSMTNSLRSAFLGGSK